MSAIVGRMRRPGLASGCLKVDQSRIGAEAPAREGLSSNTDYRTLQRIQEVHEVSFLLIRKPNTESLVVEIHRI
jgi:hypothetical protein